IDRQRYLVLRGDTPLDLTSKLLDLLLYFIDHAGALVTKEQLLDALWPDANVTENALTQAVSDLRDALGDEPGAPQFIRTVARRGYRFIAAIETMQVDTSDQAVSRGRPPADARAHSVEDKRTIAVLDFSNVSGDAESAWLTAGIAETVTG